jgi:hypothetical protein
MKLLIAVSTLIAVSAFAQTIVPIPLYIPADELRAAVALVDEPEPPAVAPPAAPPAPAKPTKRARFDKTLKTAAGIALVVSILAARIYATGHAF